MIKSDYEWVFLANPATFIVATAALLLLVVWGITIWAGRHLSLRQQILLAALRLFLFVSILVLLYQPALDKREVEQTKGELSILIDESASMSLPNDNEQTRFARATAFAHDIDVTIAHDDRFSHLTPKFYLFGKNLRPITSEKLADITPSVNSSNLLPAIDSISKIENRSAILLLSDGNFDDAKLLTSGLDSATKNALRRLNVPINIAKIARPTSDPDLAIGNLAIDNFAFVHNKTDLSVEVLARNFDGPKIRVSLLRNGVETASKIIFNDKHRERYLVDFSYVPEATGKDVYTLLVEPVKGESIFVNNIKHFQQPIVRDKIRILHVIGSPSWDSRFLNQVFRANPNVELVTFYILRNAEDIDSTPESELSLITFPEREIFLEQLGSFDLVVLQNYRISQFRISYYGANMVNFVKNGGGLAVIGGEESFVNGNYDLTDLATILPVHLGSNGSLFGRPSEVENPSHFQPLITNAADSHPITRLSLDPEQNRDIWRRLPELLGTNLVGSPFNDAIVLLQHPFLKVANKPLPVLAVRDVAKGRTLSLTVDSTWRWAIAGIGAGVDPIYYSQFWWNAVRWLIHDPQLNLLKVTLAPKGASPTGRASHASIDSYEKVTLVARARLYDSNFAPRAGGQLQFVIVRTPLPEIDAGGRLTLPSQPTEKMEETGSSNGVESRAAPASPLLEKTVTTDSDGVATVTLEAGRPGVYSVTVRTLDGADEAVDRALVSPQVDEFSGVAPRWDLMEKLASSSGGATLEDGDVANLQFRRSTVRKVVSRKVVRLWNHPVVLLALVLLMGTIWYLQRRSA